MCYANLLQCLSDYIKKIQPHLVNKKVFLSIQCICSHILYHDEQNQSLNRFLVYTKFCPLGLFAFFKFKQKWLGSYIFVNNEKVEVAINDIFEKSCNSRLKKIYRSYSRDCERVSISNVEEQRYFSLNLLCFPFWDYPRMLS